MTAPRSAAAMTLAALTASALAGCSWRLETPAPTWPSPDAVTLARDAAAEREQAVLDALSLADGTASDAVIVAYEGDAAPVRLETLGGVYVAYPGATPSPTASPAPRPDPAAAVEAARDGAMADALATDDESLAFLLESVSLSHAVTGWYAAWAEQAFTEPGTPVVEERPLTTAPTGTVAVLPEATSVPTEALTTLAVEHDRARYLYEVMAAKAADDERSQWLARRDLQAARAAALVALPGVDDTRAAVYVVDNEAIGDAEARVAAAQTAESTLAERYVSLVADQDAAEEPWLLSAAFDAYAQAAAYADPSTHDATIPALPGVASADEAATAE